MTGGIRYDAVHVSRLYLAELAAPWIASAKDHCPVLLDCDEDDAAAHRRIAAMERRRHDLFAAAWTEAEATAFACLAAEWLPQFGALFAASANEARSLAAHGVRALVVPNVVPAACAQPRQHRKRRLSTIVFVGTLGYAPNADAISWFVARVWRLIERALRFRVRLMIVGGHPPALARLGAQRGIELTGAVPDVAPFYRDADLAIAPLRAGGGTRIKVIEAAAHGVPLVATRFAAEGTTFQHGAEMLVANDAATFARACLSLLRDRSLAARMAARARAKATRDYSREHWSMRVADRVACLLDARSVADVDEGIDVDGDGAGKRSRDPRGA